MNNPNHPKPGSSIKVEPIRNLEDIEKIRVLLKDHPRNLALFTVGINTNLRASDLLRLKVKQVEGIEAGNSIQILEKKTKKSRMVILNHTCTRAISHLVWGTKCYFLGGNDPLFKNPHTGKALTVPSVHRLVKSWCREIGLKGNYGSHTLRKTWGYHQRVTFGVDIARLMICFNHSSQRQTLDYLCIQPEEIREVFLNEL